MAIDMVEVAEGEVRKDHLNPKRRARQKEKFLQKRIGQAIRDYDMIQKGDKICIAVSGGQDSLTLLKILSSKTVSIPLGYTLFACNIEMQGLGHNCQKKNMLKNIFEDLDIPYYFGKVNIESNIKRKLNPCFWCSWNKRKAIFQASERFGCNKIAFGHHKDDIIETMLLNLLFKGEIATMNPKQVMFGGKITIIRPLCYTEKKEITIYAKAAGIPVQQCSCPYSDTSKRVFVRDIIDKAAKTSRVVKTNIFRAPSRVREGYLGEILA